MKTYWHQESLYFDAKSYFAALLHDISTAEKSIALETYIFKKGPVGEKIIAALREAAARGVQVRVLMDGIGSDEDGMAIIAALTHPNIQARIFRPLPWRFALHRISHAPGKWHQKLLNFIWRINKRNHRKLCVIDNDIAWIGSFNITEEHFGAWKDIAARVHDENVDNLLNSFEEIWQRIDTKNRYHRFRNFISNHSRRMRLEKNARLVAQVNEANTRVWITNAYFSPSRAFLKALGQAVKRRVSVQIIVPEKSDVIFFPALTSTYYADLLKAGVRIFEYRGKVLHEKSMLIDNTAIIGSTNLNYRSFLHDLELDLLLNQPETIRQMEDQFNGELQQCREITAPLLQQYPRLLLLLGWLSHFFRYWL